MLFLCSDIYFIADDGVYKISAGSGPASKIFPNNYRPLALEIDFSGML